MSPEEQQEPTPPMGLIDLLAPPQPESIPDTHVISAEPLRVEASMAEAWPWPGLVVRAAVRLGSTLVRLKKLSPHRTSNGTTQSNPERGTQRGPDTLFRCHGVLLEADPVDALIIRTLLGLPSIDGVAYRATGELFAPILALLRQSSSNMVLRETERLAACLVLRHPPRPVLTIEGQSDADGWHIEAQPGYADGENELNLGLPTHRGPRWWTFASSVAPAPAPFDQQLLNDLFASGPRQLHGREAFALAEKAAEVQGLALRLPTELALAIKNSSKRKADNKKPSPLVGEPVEAPSKVEGGRREHSPSTLLRAVSLSNGERGMREPQPEPTQAQPNAPPAPSSDSPWNVYVAQAIAGAAPVGADLESLRLSLGDEDEETWLSLENSSKEGNALSDAEIARLMKLRKKWLRQNAALEGPLPLFGFGGRSESGWRTARRNFTRLVAEARERVGAIFTLAGTAQQNERYKAFLDRLKGFKQVEDIDPPDGLRANLRPYQAHGYHWLSFLAGYGLNGVLADEMGLGKTLQALALLLAQRQEEGSWPSLIVCPTSLVDNWAAEALRFTPQLRVMRYRGSPARRDRLRKLISEQDVILTTYATARIDASLLKDEQWRFIILDEAHTIKNASAATTKALKTIPGRHRLALTGTPVQNRLDELWSLFDFLMPGYLGRRTHFYRDYEEPIVRGQTGTASKEERTRSGELAQHLRERIGPFILRRLKSEVAKDLPAKIEQTIPCRLTPDQVALYRQYGQSDEAQSAVQAYERHGAGAQAQVLAALTHLRKICNHPDLMYLTKEIKKGKRIVPLPGYENRSGKIPALCDLLDQCRSGGHRALIFCQHTSMLDILEHLLRERRDGYLRLDGSTQATSRQGLVDRFNADDSLLAFLLSTRAGGAGLNLTGADTVIFYDHDWNPANDRQAQDRAYRIGQTRVVNVYRMVTKGTLEDKILERQARKQDLAESVVKHDESGFKNLSRDELLSLFSLGATQKDAAD